MVVVDLGELDDPEERERYLEFLAENDITFARTGNGDGFVADVVLVGQGDDPQQQQPPQTSLPVFEDASTPTSRSSARASVHKFRKPFKKGPRPPNETERMLRAVSRQQDEQRRRQERDFASHDQRQHQVRHRTSSGFNASDYSSYGAFCSLIETKHNRIAPRSRTIKWTLGLVNELYDERSRLLALASSNAEYASDVSPRHAQSFGGDPELLRIFPVFVMDHLGKRYGLRRIIDQVGWDLVFNIHSARRNSLPVEMFARFLEEYYDEADVGFFLTIRAAVDQVVQQYHGSKRHHRSGSVGSTTSSAPPPPVMLRWNEVLTVAKAAYYAGSPHCADSSWQEHYRNLIDLAEEHCAVGDSSTGTGEGEGTVALLMEADELLHLAVAQFHDSRSQNQDAQVDRILEGEQKRRVLDHVLQEAQNAYRDKLRELGFAEKRAQGQLRRDMAYEQRLDEMCRAIKASAASRASKGNELELTDQKVRNWAMQLLGTEIQDGPREEDPDSEQMPSFRSTNKDNKGQDARALDETPIEHPPFVLPPSDIFERNRKTGSNRRPTSSSPPISPVAAPPPAPPPLPSPHLPRLRPLLQHPLLGGPSRK